jgi:hypothetical protein
VFLILTILIVVLVSLKLFIDNNTIQKTASISDFVLTIEVPKEVKKEFLPFIPLYKVKAKLEYIGKRPITIHYGKPFLVIRVQNPVGKYIEHEGATEAVAYQKDVKPEQTFKESAFFSVDKGGVYIIEVIPNIVDIDGDSTLDVYKHLTLKVPVEVSK